MTTALEILALLLVLVSPVARAQCDGEGLVVTFSPPAASPGEAITVTLTNHSPRCTYSLPSGCVFRSVHAWDCSFPAVRTPQCGVAPVALAPGESLSQVWDQTDDAGLPVAAANYAFRIEVTGTSAVTLCPVIEVGDCTLGYGPEDPGTGGFAPAMSTAFGGSFLGNSSFHITIIDGLGGAPAILLASAAPAWLDLPFGSLLVDLAAPHFAVPIVLGGPVGAVGSGSALLYAPVPAAPELVGVTIWMQTLVVDAGSDGGVAASTGLRVRVCSL